MGRRRIDIDPKCCDIILFFIFLIVVIVLHIVRTLQLEAGSKKLIDESRKDINLIISEAHKDAELIAQAFIESTLLLLQCFNCTNNGTAPIP